MRIINPFRLKQLALELPSSAWKDIGWRQGCQETLHSRFGAVRLRPAHRDYKRTEPYPEEWLLIEWPKRESEPTKYWLSTLPVKTSLKSLVKIAKHRWIIERDYEELKQELGLGHYEGRSWRGFHHHATLCIAAYGFLTGERNRFPPSIRVGHVGLSARNCRWTSAARVAESVPNDIIPAQLLRCGLSPPASCSGSCLIAPSAEPAGAVNLSIHVYFHNAGLWTGMVGAVCHEPSINCTLLSFSSAIQRQFASEPSACSPVELSQRTDSKVNELGPRLFRPNLCGQNHDLGRGRWHE